LSRQRPRSSTLCPYTTLFRSHVGWRVIERGEPRAMEIHRQDALEPGAPRIRVADSRAFERRRPGIGGAHRGREIDDVADFAGREDRKSTRLNSSHQIISYAVF